MEGLNDLNPLLVPSPYDTMFLSASSPAIEFVSPNYPTIGAIAGSYGGVAWDNNAALLVDVTGKTRP